MGASVLRIHIACLTRSQRNTWLSDRAQDLVVTLCAKLNKVPPADAKVLPQNNIETKKRNTFSKYFFSFEAKKDQILKKEVYYYMVAKYTFKLKGTMSYTWKEQGYGPDFALGRASLDSGSSRLPNEKGMVVYYCKKQVNGQILVTNCTTLRVFISPSSKITSL